MSGATKPHPAPEAPIMCCLCGSPEWFRCSPGQSDRASHLTPDQRQSVLLFPTEDVPMVAYCISCDPMLVRALPIRAPQVSA